MNMFYYTRKNMKIYVNINLQIILEELMCIFLMQFYLASFLIEQENYTKIWNSGIKVPSLKRFIKNIILSVQEVFTILYNNLLYKPGQDFMYIQYHENLISILYFLNTLHYV